MAQQNVCSWETKAPSEAPDPEGSWLSQDCGHCWPWPGPPTPSCGGLSASEAPREQSPALFLAREGWLLQPHLTPSQGPPLPCSPPRTGTFRRQRKTFPSSAPSKLPDRPHHRDQESGPGAGAAMSTEHWLHLCLGPRTRPQPSFGKEERRLGSLPLVSQPLGTAGSSSGGTQTQVCEPAEPVALTTAPHCPWGTLW